MNSAVECRFSHSWFLITSLDGVYPRASAFTRGSVSINLHAPGISLETTCPKREAFLAWVPSWKQKRKDFGQEIHVLRIGVHIWLMLGRQTACSSIAFDVDLPVHCWTSSTVQPRHAASISRGSQKVHSVIMVQLIVFKCVILLKIERARHFWPERSERGLQLYLIGTQFLYFLHDLLCENPWAESIQFFQAVWRKYKRYKSNGFISAPQLIVEGSVEWIGPLAWNFLQAECFANGHALGQFV